MPILASLSDTKPIAGATVGVKIKDPADAEWTLPLYDDGLHNDGKAADGFYGNTFYGNHLPGSYVAVVKADGKSSTGQSFHRQLRTSFNVESAPDRDGDGLPDWWEVEWGTDPDVADANDDPDGDGLTNTQEFERGTDPHNPDTDGGGEMDGSEFGNPLDPADDRIEQPRAVAWPGVGRVWIRFTVKPEYDQVSVYRREAPDQAFQLVGAAIPAESGEWVDNNVVNGQNYCYRVAAVGKAGQRSAPSNITCATPKRDPIAPTGYVLINGGAQVAYLKDVELSLWAQDNPRARDCEGPGSPPYPIDEAEVSSVTEMLVSNDGAFAGSVWEPYQTQKPWQIAPAANGLATVFVRFRDAAGNESVPCHATIKWVEAGAGLKRRVLNELVALRATVTDRQDGNKLDVAIMFLAASLEPALWVDQTHVVEVSGGLVFQREKQTIEKFEQLIKAKLSTVPKATLQNFIDRLLRSDRLLAVVALNEAGAAGGNAQQIALAQAALARGDADAAAGKFSNAVEGYRIARMKALQSF